MAAFALIAGILFQESTRKVTYEAVGAALHWEAVYHLALLHGHSFIIGVLIPVAILVAMQFSLMMGGAIISEKSLKWGVLLYQIGVVLSVLLMLYKGYHYVLSVRKVLSSGMGQLDIAQIQHSFFGGQELLKQVVYGVSHVAMSAGIIVLLVGIWRSLPSKSSLQSN
ncbi:MAG: DUF2871 family protein [Candidatus Doudnabacteria bacterium]|nr:DUF2871 family protein [Candidatus Doudnabacteria bacterium]